MGARGGLDTNKGIVPIFIGVTGHRDLIEKDIPDIKKKVRALITHIQSLCPNSPVSIMSPLADGADRLVALVGLEMKGVSLLCPLPLPKSEYMRDFDDKSKNEFEYLLSKANHVVELPLADGSTPDNIKEYSTARNNQYEAVGKYVAWNSQILIALWNGKDTGETGGTASVVKYRLLELDIYDSGPVYHIFTDRYKTTGTAYTPELLPVKVKDRDLDLDVLYPIGWRHKYEVEDDPKRGAKDCYKQLLQDIDEFNRYAANLNEKDLLKVEQSKNDLCPDKKHKGVSDGLNNIANVYAYADVLALQNQNVVHRSIVCIQGLVLASFLFLNLFAYVWAKTYMLLIFIFLLGIGFCLYYYISRKKYEKKYIDYRVLAEGLRVQFFWKYMSSRKNVYEDYHLKYRDEIVWVVHAMRCVSMAANIDISETKPIVNRRNSIEDVINLWVRDQSRWFKKRVNEKTSISKRLKINTKILLFIVFVLVFYLLIMKADSYKEFPHSNLMDMKNIQESPRYLSIMIAIEMCILIAAAHHTYGDKRAFTDEVKQYLRMADIFNIDARSPVEEALRENRLDDAENRLIEIGREALTENGDWLFIHRSHPLKRPL
ncbi:MAG: hypothetical protein HQK99_01250 [Nitrospirae bacterium]|nr:hypothetical protein [Nitrospirota bacterium]